MPVKSGKSCWRVFYTASRAEKKCEERLARCGLEVFLPKREVTRQWKDRRRQVVEPLFKNYLFAYVDEAERITVLQVPGIVQCVRFGKEPAVLSVEEVEQLKILQQDPSRLQPVPYALPDVGSDVVVTGGPFEGLRGEVIEHRGEAQVLLHIHSIRQSVRVRLGAALVEPAPPRQAVQAAHARTVDKRYTFQAF